MHIKNQKNNFDILYLYIKRLFLVLLWGLTIYLIYINRSDLMKLIPWQKYQYGQVISFDGEIMWSDGVNIIARANLNQMYILKSTTIDIWKISWTSKISWIIIWYDEWKYIINVTNSVNKEVTSDPNIYYNSNMELYAYVNPGHQFAKDYEITNDIDKITIQNSKIKNENINIFYFSCSDCSTRTFDIDFVSSNKLTYVKVSENERMIRKGNIYMPLKLKSSNRFLVYQFSQYIQFMDGDFVYDYINKNITQICNDNKDYITAIDEFTTKYQNNQRFVIIKWVTKNRSKNVCQIRVDSQDNSFSVDLINFYKLEE